MELKLIDINDVGFVKNFGLNAFSHSIATYRHLFVVPAVYFCDDKRRWWNQNIHQKMDFKLMIDINDVDFVENLILNALPLYIATYRNLFLVQAAFSAMKNGGDKTETFTTKWILNSLWTLMMLILLKNSV